MSYIILYHANCNDGFGAAWAFHKSVGLDVSAKECTYIPVNYNEPFPLKEELSKDDVIFVLDFSYPKEVLENVAAEVDHIRVYDHHKTAIEMYKDWTPPENVKLVLSQEHSGAAITWGELYSRELPPLICYIQDRDMWWHALPDTHEINAVISAHKRTFENYDKLNRTMATHQGRELVAAQGRLLLGYKNELVESFANLARPIKIVSEKGEQFDGLCSNCPGQFASDVGSTLAKRSGTFGASYYSDESGVIRFSLRSFGEFDVSAIAKEFGGGGHKNAAGFKLENPNGEPGNQMIIYAVPLIPAGVRPVTDSDLVLNHPGV